MRGGVGRSEGVGLGGRGSEVGRRKSRGRGSVGRSVGRSIGGREGGGRILRTYKVKTNAHATINAR